MTDIFFPRLPIWKGVHEEPTIQDFYPIQIGQNDRGYFQQIIDHSLKKNIIQAYRLDSYQFISTPPGCSTYGDHRGKKALEYLLKGEVFFNGSSILDIGAGTDYIAHKLTERFQVSDYIIVDPAIQTLYPSPQYKILKKYFSPMLFPEKIFDIIICMNCIEHVEDPFQLLMDMKKILREEYGVIFIVLPNIEKQFRMGDLNSILHEHISYFTQNSFCDLISLCGLELLACSNQNGTLFCILRNIKDEYREYNMNPKDNGSVKENFDKSIQYFKKLVERLCEKNSTIAFHGACNGLNNLLSLTGIPLEKLFQSERCAIYDGDENKTGRFFPIYPAKIRHSTESAYSNFDHVIVSAMTFYNEIKRFLIQKHRFHDHCIHPAFPI